MLARRTARALGKPSDKPPVVMLSGIRWDFLWQRHQVLATHFVRAGYPTIFVETTGLSTPRPTKATSRKVLTRLLKAGRKAKKSNGGVEGCPTIYSPLVAPPTARLFRLLNRHLFVPRVARDLRALLVEQEPLVVAYPPTRTTLDIISGLEPRLLYYDCSENYAGFPGVPRDVDDTEEEMLRRADVVSCTSRFLLEKVRRHRPDAFLCGPGVDYDRFALLQGEARPKIVRVVCFFGHISEERVDFSIVRAVAQAGFTVRLVGGLGRVDESVLGMPGVEHWGEVQHAELREVLAGEDAFRIPYRISALTKGISPAKIYECFATGKPIVATPLPELASFTEHVYLADGAQAFVESLRRLPALETEGKARTRADLAKSNSWEARFRTIEEALWRKT